VKLQLTTTGCHLPQWVISHFGWVRGWAFWLRPNTNLSTGWAKTSDWAVPQTKWIIWLQFLAHLRLNLVLGSTKRLSHTLCQNVKSLSVTCHATQVNTPRLNTSQTGQYSIYLYPGGIEDWVDLGNWLNTQMVYRLTDGHGVEITAHCDYSFKLRLL